MLYPVKQISIGNMTHILQMQLNIAINGNVTSIYPTMGGRGDAIEGRKGWMELQFARRQQPRRFRFPRNKENHLQTAQIFRPATEQIKKQEQYQSYS